MLDGYLDFMNICPKYQCKYQKGHLIDNTGSDIKFDIQGVGYHPS
jgi:hypothetical protein